ncbi:MAG: hypothetical protein K1W16_13430 [Lachnospiraceae bacterium]|jgi:hypothetical protein
MGYQQKYENLLQTLCYAYEKMFCLLEGIGQCDEKLASLSVMHRPNVEEVHNITFYKERLIATLDQLSIAVEPIHEQLDGISELCQEVNSHPLYCRMEDLQILTYYNIRKIINKEDINNPDIIHRLNSYKESLELDAILNAIPESQKQVFMLIPERKV